jgi:hypothetical protein
MESQTQDTPGAETQETNLDTSSQDMNMPRVGMSFEQIFSDTMFQATMLEAVTLTWILRMTDLSKPAPYLPRRD